MKGSWKEIVYFSEIIKFQNQKASIESIESVWLLPVNLDVP